MLADIARRLVLASDDELLVIDRVLLSLERTRETEATDDEWRVLDAVAIATMCASHRERQDLLVRSIRASVLLEQAERAELAEAARLEIEREWSGAEQRTAISDAPAQLARRELDHAEPYDEFDLSEDDRTP